MSIKVLVADDHPIVLSGVQRLAGENDVEVVGSVTCPDELISAIGRLRPDVVVMECRMGGSDALKVLETLPTDFPAQNIIVYSAFANTCHIARASSLGCHEFIMKTAEIKDLLAAIKSAADGKTTLATSLISKTRSRMRRVKNEADTNNPLTNREMQVLQHVAMGLSNREVGKGLGISVETVKEHVQNILRKLNVNDRTQAAVWAVRSGFV